MNSADFVKRFIDELGDVHNWYHNGVVNELPFACGLCVCGHQIKFEYYIVNRINNEKRTLGSECIEHFKDYDIDLYNSLISSKKNFKDKKKQEKEEILKNECVVLEEKYTLNTNALKEYKKLRGFVLQDIYSYLYDASHPRKYKTTTGYYKFLTSMIERGNVLCKMYDIPIKEFADMYAQREFYFNRIRHELDTNKKFFGIMEEYLGSNRSVEGMKEFFDKYDAGMLVPTPTYEIIVTGKTYPVKESLKSEGFMWSGRDWRKIIKDKEYRPLIDTTNIEFTVNEIE